MNWLFSSKTIILYFYALMLASTLLLGDFYVFAVLLQYYDVQFLLILMGILCGIGALITLNSIAQRTKTMRQHVYHGQSVQALFAEILVLCVAGTLMIFPGPVSSFLGIVLYVKPVRLACAHALRRHKAELVARLSAAFIAEQPRNNSQ